MDELVLTHVDHLGCLNADRAVHRGKSLVELSHVTADRGRLLNQVRLYLHVGEVERGGNPGNSPTDHQRASSDRHLKHLQWVSVADLCNSGRYNLLRLLKSLLLLMTMNPRIVLTNVCHLK